jgi:hypothetical protein
MKMILCPLKNWPSCRANLTTRLIIGPKEKLSFASESVVAGFSAEKSVWHGLSLSGSGKAVVIPSKGFWTKFIDKGHDFDALNI